MALPVVQFSTWPGEIDVFIDPLAGSPTAFGTSTDHALEHSKVNDVCLTMEYALNGVGSTANSPQGVPLADHLGRLVTPGPALNVPLVAYGHGGLTVPGAHSSTGADVLTLTNKRLSALSATSYAVVGSRLLDVFFDLLGGYGGAVTGAAWSSPKRGVIILDAERNDFYNPTSGSTWANLPALAVTNYGQTLTAVLAILGSSTRLDANSSTTTGTWGSVAGNFSGGACESTTAQNSSLTYPAVTVPTSGVLYHLGFTTTVATGDTTVSIGGTNLATATSGGAAGASAIWSNRTGSVNIPSSYKPQVTKISNLTPGSSVQVTVTKTDASTNPIYVDSLLVPSNQPPLIVVVLDCIGNNTTPVPSAPPTGWATQLAVASVNKPLLDAQINTVVPSFPNVVTVDLNANLSSYDLSYVTGSDLNDRGQRKFSDLLSYTIGSWSYSNDSDALYQTL